MSTKIRVLSDLTINKIAAGEVIENPASVVKELTENAIDAGSTKICIEIIGGGRQLIRISDDGCGMVPDDALLCLERHATSKIRDVDDIHEIQSMGFRGEAVPSIASISKFTILTSPRVPSNQSGTLIIVDGGKILSCAPAVRSPGTTIEVKSLFFNVPVRKKFQKSPSYDTNEILKMVSLLALGHPRIQFELISDEKPLLTPTVIHNDAFEALLAARIDSILGSEFASSILPVHVEKGDCLIQGFIGTPGHHRQNRSGQYLFINKRAITSPLVSFAVRDGYGPTLPPQRHPVFVIHLTIPGSMVDVNVHPQKREVRLRQESLIRDLLKESVQKALQRPSEGSTSDSAVSFNTSSTFQESASPLPWDTFSAPTTTQPILNEEPSQPEPPPLPAWSPPPQNQPSVAVQELFVMPEQPKKPRLRVVTTMPRYILIEKDQGVCLVDQAAARRRILFEQLMHRMQPSHQSPNAYQQLLIPHTVDLPNVEASLMRSHLDTLNQMGFSIHEFGSNTFHIDALPPFFSENDLSAALSSMLHDIHQLDDSQQVSREREKQIALAASRSTHDTGKRLSIDEAQSLVNQLMGCESPFQCPQGKPTLVDLNPDEIAKQFRIR